MKDAMVKIVVKEPFKKPEVKDVPNTLEAKQAIVGGYIQAVPVFDDGNLALFCNEEGKFAGLAPNVVLPFDVVVGTVYVSKCDEEGEEVSLTEAEIAEVTSWLSERDVLNV